MTTVKFLDEVVDDSEPEREELRRREKDERRKKRRSNLTDLKREEANIIELTDEESRVDDKIIEISDDCSSIISVSPNYKKCMGADVHGPTRRSQKPAVLAPSKGVLRDAIVMEGSDTPRSLSDVSSLPDGTSEPQLLQSRNSSLDNVNDQHPILKTQVFLNPILNDSEVFRDSESEVDNMGVNLNLACFAFQSTRPPPKPPHSGPSRLGSAISNAPKANPSAEMKSVHKAVHRFTVDFSDAELAKLKKCVSCDVRWTTRKSAAQKMTHVQSCAKKNRFTDETVRLLIRREIDTAVAENVKAKGKGKGTSVPLASESTLPKTFYEDIIHDTAPKKKGKRQEVRETVKSVTETRSDILDRARTVLDLGKSSSLINQDEDFSIQTQTFSRSKLGQAFSKGQLLPAIQDIATSERQLSLKSNAISPGDFDFKLVDVDVDVDDINAPPPTQHFAPSKLAQKFRPPLEYDGAQYQGGDSSEYLLEPHSLASSPSNPINGRTTDSKNTNTGLTFDNPDVSRLFDFAISSGREHSHRLMGTRDENIVGFLSPAHTLRSLGIPNLSSRIKPTPGDKGYDQSQEPVRNNDKDYLYSDRDCHNQKYDGANDEALMTQEAIFQHNTNTMLTLKPTRVTQLQSKTMNHDNEEFEVLTRNTPKKKSKGKTRDRNNAHRAAVPDCELDENWEQRIKGKILEDQALHLRILRYEPIHFDIFLKFIADKPSRGLRARLRSFLDDQAINFYGAEPKSSRL